MAKNFIGRSLHGIIDPYPSIQEIEMLWEYFTSQCAYCGKKLDRESRYGHIDHLLNLDSLNYNNIHNCVLACQECNGNEKREQDWISFLKNKNKGDDELLTARKEQIEKWHDEAPTDKFDTFLEVEIKNAIGIALNGYSEALSRLKSLTNHK